MEGPSAQPGWYPVGNGTQRYWDGTRWTDHLAPMPSPPSGVGDDKTWAILSHVLTSVGGFIAPLVIYLIKKDESPFVRHHAAEALNFQLSVLLYAIISLVLILVLVGLVLLFALGIGTLIFTIIAAVAASNGERYRYPLTIRFVK